MFTLRELKYEDAKLFTTNYERNKYLCTIVKKNLHYSFDLDPRAKFSGKEVVIVC